MKPPNDSVSAEHRLSYHLLNGYNKHVRPVTETGEITFVFVELSLFNILKMVSVIIATGT